MEPIEKKEFMSPPQKGSTLHWFHWLIIFFSLCLTFFAWFIADRQVEEKRFSLFSREAEQVVDLVIDRMDHYEDALWSGASFIQIDFGDLNLQHWTDYVSGLNLIEKYPGINGMGVILKVERANAPAYIAKQQEIRPNFQVYPEHKEDFMLPITYIIPLKGNEKAVGLDIAHEKNRFNAAREAEASGLSKITQRIILVQDKEKTPGFLFYVPYYKKLTQPDGTVENGAFLGFVYAPFIVKKLMDGTLSHKKRRVLLDISDESGSLYSDPPEEEVKTSSYSTKKTIEIYGQKWDFTIRGTQEITHAISGDPPLIILSGGIIIDTLLLLLFITISRSKNKALKYAQFLTKELKRKTNTLEVSNKKLINAKNELEKMVHYDILTRLPNRENFFSHLNKVLQEAKKNGHLVGVCFLDIDNFKNINDNLGHSAGDIFLKNFSKEFSLKTRAADYFGRLSGDEFGLIIEGTTSHSNIIEIIHDYKDSFSNLKTVTSLPLRVSLSMGVAFYPKSGNNAEELLKRSDLAMYHAKAMGKNTFALYDEEMHRKTMRRHELETGLKYAISDGALYLVYQPQIESITGNIYGVEALIRWNHPTLGIIEPSEFIKVAEENGQIEQIGFWVLKQVAKDYEYLEKLNKNICVSINISIRQLESSCFKEELKGIFKENKILPDSIILEITETAIMNDPEKITTIMRELSATGLSFSLDDFGTGYSSMSYLKRLPIKHIKIDQSFVRDIEEGGVNLEIIKTIILLSMSLGAKTTAEGVETQAQVDFLKRHNCDYLQGYHFSRPLLLQDLIKAYQGK